MTIGLWAWRVRFGDPNAPAFRGSSTPGMIPVTLPHLVESEVADRLVVRCGRELHAKRDLPFEFTSAKPERVCFYCGLAERLGRYVGGAAVVER